MLIASFRVNSVSAVPCVMRVGMVTRESSVFGPWAANHALSAGAIVPDAIPFTQVLNMCGSSRESWTPSWFRSPPGTDAHEAEPAERAAPAELERVVLVQARCERVPGDVRRDHVHARIARRGDPLDPAAVGPAAHAHARISGPVELGLGLPGQPVDQRGGVAGLVVRRVHLHRSAREPESARVPGEHVVAGAAQRPHAHVAHDLERGGVLVRLPRLAEPGTDQHGGRTMAGRQPLGREEVHVDGRLVEGADGGVTRLGGGGASAAITATVAARSPATRARVRVRSMDPSPRR